MQKKLQAFSLVELLVVVVIIAILAAIAIPAYNSHIRKSRRQEAISDLLHIQMLEERYRTNNATYGTSSDLASDMPSNDNYDFTITVPAESSHVAYTITATAKVGNDQNNDTQNGTVCSAISVNQSNTKSPSDCW